MPLANQFARLIARIIDAVILGGLLAVIAVGLGIVGDTRLYDLLERAGEHSFAYAACIATLSVAYEWVFLAVWGATPGKLILGLRVRSDAGELSPGHAAGRAFSYTLLGTVCGCLGVVDAVWCLFDRDRQCLHDKLANTLVVTVR